MAIAPSQHVATASSTSRRARPVTRAATPQRAMPTAHCPICPDNFLNTAAGEECDTGGESAACDADCTFPVCPDNYLNEAAGEVCDDGVANGSPPGFCEPLCAAPGSCGNLIVETGEDCDPGTQTATCDNDCSFADCGDGALNLDRRRAMRHRWRERHLQRGLHHLGVWRWDRQWLGWRDLRRQRRKRHLRCRLHRCFLW